MRNWWGSPVFRRQFYTRERYRRVLMQAFHHLIAGTGGLPLTAGIDISVKQRRIFGNRRINHPSSFSVAAKLGAVDSSTLRWLNCWHSAALIALIRAITISRTCKTGRCTSVQPGKL